jgi:hypothetical protein
MKKYQRYISRKCKHVPSGACRVTCTRESDSEIDSLDDSDSDIAVKTQTTCVRGRMKRNVCKRVYVFLTKDASRFRGTIFTARSRSSGMRLCIVLAAWPQPKRAPCMVFASQHLHRYQHTHPTLHSGRWPLHLRVVTLNLNNLKTSCNLIVRPITLFSTIPYV